MKKKFIIVFVILAIIIISSVRSYEENQFPQNEDFLTEIICVPTMKTGDKILVDAQLSNIGKRDYFIEYTKLFILSIDGRKYIQNDADASFGYALSPGETISESFDYIPIDIGIHEIMIETVFEVRLPSGQTKKYRYQTKSKFSVTD